MDDRGPSAAGPGVTPAAVTAVHAAFVAAALCVLLASRVRGAEVSHLARNDAVELTVSAVRTAGRYGPRQPPADREFLVISTEWRNLLPATPIDGTLAPTPYVVPALDRQLFLVADGRIAPFAALDGRPGVLPRKDFTAPDPSTPVRGNLVFEVPPDPGELHLVLVDERHGAVSLPLTGQEAAAPADGRRAMRNEVLEALVTGARTLEAGAGPAETIGVSVRLRSIFRPDGKAKCAKLVSLPDWQGRYIQALVDGAYAASPVSGPFGGEAATILPEAATGGELVFRVPKQRKSLRLVLCFGELPTASGKLRPGTISLPVAGEGSAAAEPPRSAGIVSTRDDLFEVSVTGVSAVDEFAGARPGDGRKFLLVDAAVMNIGRQPEIFQGLEQLQHVSEGGEATPVDPATFAGARPPVAALFVPPGELRAFELVFAIEAGETRPRIAYASATPGASKILALPPLGATTTAVAGAEPPSRQPMAEAAAAEPGPGPSSAAPDPAGAPAAGPAPAVAAVPTVPGAKASPPVAESAGAGRSVEPTAAWAGDARPDPKKLPVRLGARQGRAPKGLAGVGLRPEDVNAAIDRGAAWLWKWIEETELRGAPERFGGSAEDLLYALALVHADFHRKSAAFDGALRGWLGRFEATDLRGGYGAGVLCMLVESYGDPTFLPKLRLAARYLIEAQGTMGTWTYTAPIPPDVFRDPNRDRVLQVSGGAPLDGTEAEPWTRLTDPSLGRDGDNSVSQFSLLGLHAASRSGVPVPDDVWARNLTAQRERQNEDGGWGYVTDGSYGSMTCAGICSIAIDRHELGEKDPLDDPAIEKGLGWLSAHFTVSRNPQSSRHDYYYLYSLERVGRILDTEFIGPDEWYPVGAKHLVTAQAADGHWKCENEGIDPIPTSYALLFLTRATPTLNVAMERGGDGILKTGVVVPPSQRIHFILDASGSMIPEMDGRPKFDIARDAVASIVRQLGDGSEVGLRVYGHRRRAIEKDADEDTQLVIPLGRLDRAATDKALRGLRARGRTPLALSMEQARGDLGGASRERPVTVVLLTDGGEDTVPRRDPLKPAEELGKIPGVELFVVGFDISDRPDWDAQLRGIAERAGGRYLPAARADVLERELRSAVFGTPDAFVVLDGEGKKAAAGRFGESRTLREGKYVLRTEYGGRDFEEPFWVNTHRTTAVTFDARRIPSRGGAASAGAAGATVDAPRSDRPGASTSPPTVGPLPPAADPHAATKRFCSSCGKPLKAGARFCADCGARVGG